jgi:cytochrome c oxidase assembly factor CtaG
VITPNNLWGSWSFEPAIATSIVLLAVAYLVGLRRLWSRGRGRGISMRQSVNFFGGLAVLSIALLSPLDRLAGSLFSAHMVQHLLLILVAPPLLVAASTGTALGLALPIPARRKVRAWERHPWFAAVTRVLSQPVAVLMLHVTALYLWHLPVLYQAALNDDLVHGLEHASFFGTAWLFWWLILDEKGRRKLGDGAAVLFVFLAGLASGALGALLTFAPRALYPLQALGAGAWGLTPVTDQQLAGLIMWVPAGVVYLLTAAVLFLRWMSGIDTPVTQKGGAVG